MASRNGPSLSTLPRDLTAGLVVSLVALPLCLGVALASALLPAWEAYRVSVFELLQSR